ncbi:Uncharacterized protein BM_BM6368 [Brugia malayi]|uniref:Bm6368 n=1 Tax=Brugia malayi TaxID=6279 RepID=A0A0I9N9X3_BRUMA|nr:Uncharacterized protein BM_BM6368 [Brugia malayi]CTP81950.1 Bm6368, isoform a [Brugia malayi]VIO96378.1 Uncharacterized protein BM_BM6368 [Brugia malayi]
MITGLQARETVMQCASAQILTCDSPWQWMCYNGQCIAQYDLCNGIAQCTDGSDEIDCNKRKWQDNGYMNVPREEQMKSAIWSGMDKCRRQRTGLARSNRAYGIRRSLNMGQNDGEDEDLLIGSLYS